MQNPQALSELVQIHQCLRAEVSELQKRSNIVLLNFGNPELWIQALKRLIQQFDFLYIVYHSHSKAEDDVILPALLKKGLDREAFVELNNEHVGHSSTFDALRMLLLPLRNVSSPNEIRNSPNEVVSLVQEINTKVDTLQSSLQLHLRHEEEELFPILNKHFRADELIQLVGYIIGDRSSELIEMYLNMVSRDLPENEKTAVLENLRTASGGTNFEHWLEKLPNNSTHPIVVNTVSTTPKVALGNCGHYKRNCEVYAACCEKYFPCRICHDEAVVQESSKGHCAWHTLDRKTIDTMKCLACGTSQNVKGTCESCGIRIARYFCQVCNLFEDDPSKSIYHCPFCNVCRVGKGLGEDFFHCMRCNACVSTKNRNHECMDHVLEHNCAICHEDLFSSNQPLKKPLLCSHMMHRRCFEEYKTHGYKCPTCRKSIVDMSNLWNELDATAILVNKIEFPNSSIHCCDCGSQSEAQYVHPVYRLGKCRSCGSYNTYT